MQIERARLPGIGVHYTLTTAGGHRIGVICHLTGRRDIVVYAADDPGVVTHAAPLSPAEAHHVAELLHTDVIIEHVGETERPASAAVVARLPVSAVSPFDGRTVRDVRSRSIAPVVAVIRDHRVVTDTEPDFVLRHGDAVVAVGSREEIAALGDLLGTGA
jgi:TrkA domain protein